MVLRNRKELHVLAVGHRHHRDLLALEKGLDHHGASRFAELAGLQHRSHRACRLGSRGTHDGALAGGEPGGLDHQRLRMAIDVGQRGGEIAKAAAGRGAHARSRHQLLGESLGGFQLRRGGTRPEDRPPLGPKPVGQAERQRDLGPHHGEIDAVHVGRVGQAVDIVGGNGKVFGELGGTWIPWGAVQLGLRILPAEGPAERVLPAPAAYHEQSHDFCAFRKASRARSAARLAASASWPASSRASPA